MLSGVRIEPRDYQRRVVARVIEMFSGPHVDRRHELPEARSVIIESPTGSGKTVMGLLVARWAQERLGMRVVWSAMRRNLLAQVERENRDRGFGVDLRTVSMFEKSPPRGELLIVDEAQHDATRSMASLHAAVGPVKVLGLSATPYRSDRLGLCFERTVRDAGIRQLVLEGHLSPYAHYTLARYSPDTVADAYLREPDRFGRSLAFFRTLAECRRCADRLAAAKVAVEVVTATTDREQQIAEFEAGRCRVILSVGVLTEGFDCPTLATVFCRPAGKGPTIQMAGRVLRRVAQLPLKNVVQCAHTTHPFTATAPAAVQYVECENGWRSIGTNSRIEEASARMLELLVSLARAESAAPSASHATSTPANPAASGRGRPRRARRGLREMNRWNYRVAEAHDRLRRTREARGLSSQAVTGCDVWAHC
ncbi:MAG: DEAD/DEAH box helicase, partial [Planctomycetia bacterium]